MCALPTLLHCVETADAEDYVALKLNMHYDEHSHSHMYFYIGVHIGYFHPDKIPNFQVRKYPILVSFCDYVV